MTISSHFDKCWYKKLETTLGSLLPSEKELEKFISETGLDWKDYRINYYDFGISFHTIEICFEDSISNNLGKLLIESNRLGKALAFCCLSNRAPGHSTNLKLNCYSLISTCCSSSINTHALHNIAKYHISNNNSIAILGHTKLQDERTLSLREIIDIISFNELLSQKENYNSFSIVYAIATNAGIRFLHYDNFHKCIIRFESNTLFI